MEKLINRINVAIQSVKVGEGNGYLLHLCMHNESVRTNVCVVVYCLSQFERTPTTMILKLEVANHIKPQWSWYGVGRQQSRRSIKTIFGFEPIHSSNNILLRECKALLKHMVRKPMCHLNLDYIHAKSYAERWLNLSF